MRQWHYGSSASGSLLYTYDCLREEDFAWLEQLDGIIKVTYINVEE